MNEGQLAGGLMLASTAASGRVAVRPVPFADIPRGSVSA